MFKAKSIITLIVIAFTASVSGCSTIFNSGSQSIMATASNGKPVKALITTPSGSYSAQLPSTIVTEPSSFNPVKISVQDDCYEPTEYNVNKTIAPSYWANLFNVYGFLIDPFTGAMWKYNSAASVPVTEKKNGNSNCVPKS